MEVKDFADNTVAIYQLIFKYAEKGELNEASSILSAVDTIATIARIRGCPMKHVMEIVESAFSVPMSDPAAHFNKAVSLLKESQSGTEKEQKQS